jgi:plasmid stability protein
MATITIRNLDENVKRELQIRAALNGRSMEAEARQMISEPLMRTPSTLGIEQEEDLGTAIRKLFAPLGGVELQIPPRQFSRQSASEELKNGLGTAIHNLFAPLGGVELQVRPRRNSQRQVPNSEE